MSFLVKKKSSINGKGIFTKKNIKKGEIFYIIPLKKISTKPKKRWALIKGKYIGDKKVLFWVNHSCNPNSKIDINKHALISLKNIKKGEEINVDYEKTENKINKTPCLCGSLNCRRYFYKGD